MDIVKNEYKIIKDNDFIGKIYNSYTIEKIITYDNGKTEQLLRSFFPHIDGNINKIDLDSLYFPKTMTNKEWNNMTPQQRYDWLGLDISNNRKGIEL